MSNKKEYCLDLSFKNVDFDSFLTGKSECPESFHSHLIIDDKDIELQIFYQSETYFEYKFNAWAQKIRWDEFGEKIAIKLLGVHERLEKFDLSEAKILSIQSGSQFQKELGKWITLKLDFCKSYWKPSMENIGTAEFYLNENGFQMVSNFYGVMWPKEDGVFSIERMNNVKDWYSIDKIKFSPQFNFVHKDSFKSTEAIINKEPKFQLQFEASIDEKRIIETVGLLTSISSFYYRNSIDFVFARIHKKQHTILIKRITNSRIALNATNSISFSLNGVDLGELFDGLIQFNFNKCNIQKLQLLVEKFWQSGFVDPRSSLLLKFAILELCKGGDKINVERYNLSHGKRKKALRTAKNAILEIIVNEKDKQDFENKWTSYFSDKILHRPMKSPFIEYLEKVGIDTNSFPVPFDEIKKMRDNVTHGSLGEYSLEDLEKVNAMIYKICIGLILNEYQIDSWNKMIDFSLS